MGGSKTQYLWDIKLFVNIVQTNDLNLQNAVLNNFH